MKQHVVLLAPHLDDAVFSGWHLLSQPGTEVVTVFGHVPPKGTHTLWDRLCGTPDSAEMMTKRLKENAGVLDNIGVTHLEMKYLDQQYRHKKVTPGEIANEVQKRYPNATRFVVPLAMGRPYRHADHILVREAGRRLGEMGYTVDYYFDVPYMKTNLRKRQMSSLARRTSRLLGAPHRVYSVALSERELKKKRQAMLQYATQFRMTNLVAFGRLSKESQLVHEIEVIRVS